MRLTVMGGAIIWLLFCFVGQEANADAANHDQSLKTVYTAYQDVIELAERERWAEAKDVLDSIERMLPAIDYEEEELTVQDIHVLLEAYEAAAASLASAQQAPENRMQGLLKFQLALDAVINENHPLFQRLAGPFQERLEGFVQSSSMNKEEAQAQFNELKNEFEVIRPALYLQHSETVRSRIDSLWVAVDRGMREGKEFHELPLQELVDELDQAFSNEEERRSIDPTLIGIMIFVSTVLVVSLSYAGWKKYKAERRRAKMSKSEDSYRQ
ncbi:sporulation protein YpjB [Salsuginibacillus kocurii]|uniref:sporulation protein YpjB n=1 Tax=Salsuginibacillus kocurii TaxID=427078 RepID=UPI000362C886|nr:sporulation protein YpjB [Salsuginibacillus kocurii]